MHERSSHMNTLKLEAIKNSGKSMEMKEGKNK